MCGKLIRKDKLIPLTNDFLQCIGQGCHDSLNTRFDYVFVSKVTVPFDSRFFSSISLKHRLLCHFQTRLLCNIISDLLLAMYHTTLSNWCASKSVWCGGRPEYCELCFSMHSVPSFLFVKFWSTGMRLAVVFNQESEGAVYSE